MILLGLGANLDGIYGSPERCLQACSSILAERGIFIICSSNIWKSAPVPMSDQPWYRNAVIAVQSGLSPDALLEVLADIEETAGRVRLTRNEPRVLDLDILTYHDETHSADHLQIPHPRMHERAFVLYPLQEVAPFWHHPVVHKSVDELILGLSNDQKVERIDGSALLSTPVDIKQGAS